MRTLSIYMLSVLLQGATYGQSPTVLGEGADKLTPSDRNAILTLCKQLYPAPELGAPSVLKCILSGPDLSGVHVFYSPTESSDRFYRGLYAQCFRKTPSYKPDRFDFTVDSWVLRSKEQLIRSADKSSFGYAMVALRGKRFAAGFPPASEFVFAKVDSRIPSADLIKIFDEVCTALGTFAFAQTDRLGKNISIWEQLGADGDSVTFHSYLTTSRLRDIRLHERNRRWQITGISTSSFD